MALRCIGAQLLQSTPSPMLAGAATASLSLWIRANPGCNVAAANGVQLFGDGAGKLSVGLAGSGTLQVAWTPNGPAGTGASRFSQALTPGTAHHLAVTWQDGLQRFFLDGSLILSDKQAGPLGAVANAATAPFRLGSDSAGTDVTLDEPTLWVGYALTAQDVSNLRDRLAAPQAIAPASNVIRWTLAGVNAAAAKVGDAGLLDGSGSKSGLQLAAIVGAAPTYAGGNLTYVAPVRIGSLQVAPSGKSVVVGLVDASGAPSNVQSILPTDDVQTLSVAALPSGGSFRLGFGGQVSAPIVVAASPPTTSATVTFAVTPGTPVWVRVSLGQPSPDNNADTLYEVFDAPPVAGDGGAKRLSSRSFDRINPPPPLDYQTFKDAKGNSLPPGGESFTSMFNLGTMPITPTGNTLTIRMTGGLPVPPSAGNVGLGYLQVTPYGNVGFNEPHDQAAYYTPSAPNVLAGPWTQYGYAPPSGHADTFAVDPAAIQSALLGLGGGAIPAGGITVAGPPAGPYTVRSGGPLAGAVQPTLTSSDPAVAVIHDGTKGSAVGGQYPSIRINGQAPITLKRPIWGARLPDGSGRPTIAPYLPYIVYPLPQSAPASQHFPAGVGASNYNQGGGSWSFRAPAGTYGPQPTRAGASTDSTAAASWSLQGLPPATYRVSATWAADPANTAAATFTVTDGSGKVLGSATADQTKAPTGATEGALAWGSLGTFTPTNPVNTLNVALSNGGPKGSKLVADCLRLERISADVSVVIAPTDAVTFTALAAFATTAAGPVPAAVNAPVTNPGAILPAFRPTPKTLRVGYNIEGASYYGTIPVYSNFAKAMSPTAFPGVLATDANGYPTRLNGPAVNTLVIDGNYADVGGSGRGVNNAPQGRYTLMWDGACVCAIYGDSNNAKVVSTRLTGAADNMIVCDFTEPFNFAPTIRLSVAGTGPNGDGTYACDLQNLRIYPPDPVTGAAWAKPTKYYPPFLAQLGGASCIRFMDPLAINGSNVRDYADLTPGSRMGYGNSIRLLSAPIAKIEGYTGNDAFFFRENRAIIQVTTSTPHGFAEGMGVQLGGGVGTITYDGGSTDLGYYDGVVHVLSPTTFLMAASGNGKAVTNVLTPAGQVVACGVGGGSSGGGMPFADTVDLCNVAKADLWLNIPALATDDCVAAMAAYVAANLAPGLRVHVEFSNECWNSGFGQWTYCVGMSHTLLGSLSTYDNTTYQVYRSVQVHRIFYAAFARANQPTTRVRRVIGTTPYSSPGSGTESILRLLAGNVQAVTGTPVNAAFNALGPIQFDEISPAPYYSNDSYVGTEPSLQVAYDLLTVDQVLDVFETVAANAGLGAFVGAHVKQVAAAGLPFPLDVVAYECGPSEMIPNGSPASANHASRSLAVARHPRMYGIHLNVLQQWQDVGLKLVNVFYLNGADGLEHWDTYLGYSMVAGTGDPARDRANIDDPTNLALVKSQVGGAMNRWASLTVGSRTNRIPPGRTGKLKSFGLFRPAR